MSDKIADLKRQDYAQYLALWLVPPDRRDFALALFDLEAELRAIPAKVSVPTLGLMRIVWWRDAVLEGGRRAHPLLQALQPHLPGRLEAVAEWIETFDLPFLAADEQAERLAARQALEDQLLGPKVVMFLGDRFQATSRITLVFKAFWLLLRA